MTELLHSAQISTTHPATLEIPEAADSVVPSTGSTSDLLAFGVRAAAQDQDGTVFFDALSASDIRALSTRHLRVLANRAYQLMDTDYPSAGAVDSYCMIAGELDIRAQQAGCRGPVDQLPVNQLRETFRDNPLYGRFELLIDGSLAVYIKYTMTGGQVILTEGVEHPAFRDQGMDAILMRHIVLNTHKRRLSLTPQCPMAVSFFVEHPHYEVLSARQTP